LIREGRRLTLARVADIVGISYGSAQAIVHDYSGYHKVCAQWVPKQLTAQHKQQRVDVATRFPQRYEGDRDRRRDMGPPLRTGEQEAPSSHVRRKFKQQPSCKKLLLTSFWDMRGPILSNFQAHGGTVNSVKYSALLQDQLIPAIRHKRRVLFPHDNARQHTATARYRLCNGLDVNCFRIPLTVPI
jgi:hypothetical protein